MSVTDYRRPLLWLIAIGSIAESQYAIKDEETEKKYHFDLADALKRAKQNAGKLFGGITFYVTPKVPVDSKLLKNVVAANGGQVRSHSSLSYEHVC